MKKYILLSAFLLAFCSKNKNALNDVKGSWIEFKTKDSIPLPLIKFLSNEVTFKIADPHEKYNATDLLIDSLPNKQLVFIAKNKNEWRMSYIQGGFGKYYVLIQCKIDNDSVYDVKISESLTQIKGNKAVEKLIQENKIKFKEYKKNDRQSLCCKDTRQSLTNCVNTKWGI